MDNIIYNQNNETIGYYADLYKMFSECIKDLLDKGSLEEAGDQLEYLKELEELKEYDGLIILSDNNGMGFTAKKY